VRVFAVFIAALGLAPLASAATVSHSFDSFPLPVLRYTAAAAEVNRLSVAEDGEWVVFRDAGAPVIAQGGCMSTGPAEARCPRGWRLLIQLGDQDDEVSITGAPAGSWSPPFQFADAPALEFLDDAGNDRYVGGPGREAFIAAAVADGADEFLGGEGRDEVQYEQRDGRVFLSLDGQPNDGAMGEGDNIGADVEDAYAGPDGMTFSGSAGGNFFWGYPYRTSLGAGRDLASGEGGDDLMHGGFGDDRLAGGPGRDAIWGQQGRDRLRGGTGGDQLIGGIDADVLRGGGGRDRLGGGNGRDLYCARDGVRDLIADGGRSIDRAYVDALDKVLTVELVFRRPCPR
jgi:Ca2+-binding RTX toxin-like protein